MDHDDELDFERAEYGDDAAQAPAKVPGEAAGDVGQPDPHAAAAADDGPDGTSAAAGSMVCTLCQQEISRRYFTKNDEFVCSRCGEPENRKGPSGSPFTRLVGAAVAGTLAAMVASALWMIVTQVTGYEIGLLAIAVGWVVGLAIMIGNRGVGGQPYRLLAVFLTYSAIVLTYVPSLAEEIQKSPFETDGTELVGTQGEIGEETALGDTSTAAGGDAEDELPTEFGHEPQAGDATGVAPGGDPDDSDQIPALVAWIIAIPLAYAAPFLMGFENVIGILIIGFALYQAWKMTAKPAIVWTGPFRIGHDAEA